MQAVEIIRRKRDGEILSDADIDAFVTAATDGSWPEYQLSALLMAIVLRGMTADETAALTRAMVHSGTILDWADIPGYKVDKHSTGGVGDKTSLILAPLAAACDCVVPMMSGRGLGHTGGTLDKLEAIPGFRVHLSSAEFRTVLRKHRCALIGQTEEIAPADKVLYALRDVTATVESIPLITASIMSKKIAEGIDGLVLDVKCGRGAFMKTAGDARGLAKSLVNTGHANGLQTIALITAMEHPLGQMVGNALEVIEAVETLKGNGPKDLEELSLTLAAHMVQMAHAELTWPQAEAKVRDALSSGRGLEKLVQIIEGQGGEPRIADDYAHLPAAAKRHIVRAPRSGFIASMHAEHIGRAAMHLGAGRAAVHHTIHHGVGISQKAKPGDQVKKGDGLAEIHFEEEHHLDKTLLMLAEAIVISDEKPAASALVLEKIVGRGA